ncbi:HAD-IIA family hydrolase [Paenibacillus paridis]|uniref:HAD-IIA family hydrolase n=1 Tax=Paenibacillus paridis TaxID=2583376 RepID=UPI001121BC1B|nr:HAD-IIA family hydrolase [Paenibacillus paridis]
MKFRQWNPFTIENIEACFFDLDGCILNGDRLAPAANTVIQRLINTNKQIIFLTNNSREPAQALSTRLAAMGLEADPGQIVAATDYIGHYLLERYGPLTAMVAGSLALSAAITQSGHIVIPADSPSRVDAVIVGLDLDFTYKKLEQLSTAIGRGAKFIAVNADLSHPGQHGEKVPETGALVAALSAVTGKQAEFAGKPEPYIFLYGMNRYGLLPNNCLMVGDNYDTDIRGGKQVGMHTVWINSLDNNKRNEISRRNPAADWIVSDLKELHILLGGME